MSAVQLMCARIGIVARNGLAGVLRDHYSTWVLWVACGLLLFRQYRQHRRGSRGNGRRNGAPHRWSRGLVRSDLRGARHRPPAVLQLRDDDEGSEMALASRCLRT
jgi:hypothetical protein